MKRGFFFFNLKCTVPKLALVSALFITAISCDKEEKMHLVTDAFIVKEIRQAGSSDPIKVSYIPNFIVSSNKKIQSGEVVGPTRDYKLTHNTSSLMSYSPSGTIEHTSTIPDSGVYRFTVNVDGKVIEREDFINLADTIGGGSFAGDVNLYKNNKIKVEWKTETAVDYYTVSILNKEGELTYVSGEIAPTSDSVKMTISFPNDSNGSWLGNVEKIDPSSNVMLQSFKMDSGDRKRYNMATRCQKGLTAKNEDAKN